MCSRQLGKHLVKNMETLQMKAPKLNKFEKKAQKEKIIAHNKQISLLQQCFQKYLHIG